MLFVLLAERYERGSVLLTSNLPFSGWESIFKDPMTTAAAIDRLVHHSVIDENPQTSAIYCENDRPRLIVSDEYQVSVVPHVISYVFGWGIPKERQLGLHDIKEIVASVRIPSVVRCNQHIDVGYVIGPTVEDVFPCLVMGVATKQNPLVPRSIKDHIGGIIPVLPLVGVGRNRSDRGQQGWCGFLVELSLNCFDDPSVDVAVLPTTRFDHG